MNNKNAMPASFRNIIAILIFCIISFIAEGQMMFRNSALMAIGGAKITLNDAASGNNKLNTGISHLKMGSYNSALNLFKKAWTVNEFRKAALNNISMSYALKGNFYLSNVYLDKSVKNDLVYTGTFLYNQLVIDGLSKKIDMAKAGEYKNAPDIFTEYGKYNKALMMSAIGNYDFSTDLFNEILINEFLSKKKTVEAFFGKAFNYTGAGNSDSAIATLNNLKKLNRSKKTASFLNGYIFQNQHKYKQAITDFRTSKRILSNNKPAIANIAYLYSHLGENDLALKWLMKFKFAKKNAESYTALGSGYFLKGKLEKAAKFYHHALTCNNNYFQALIGLGNVFVCLGKPAVAADYYAKARKIAPENLQVILAFARLNYYNQNYILAGFYYKLALINNDNDTLKLGYDELNRFAYSTFMGGNYFDALILFTHADSLNSNKVESKLYLASIYIKMEQYPEALSLLDKYIAKIDTCADAYFLRGVAKQRTDDHAGAITDYTLAMQLKKDYPEALNNRAMAYMEMDQIPNAINDITELLKKHKNGFYFLNRALVKNYMANQYDLKGERDSATSLYLSSRADYDTAFVMTADPYIYNNIGILYSDMEDTTQAAYYYNLSANKYSMNNLGVLKAEQSLYESANALFEKALEADSLYDEALQNHSMVAGFVSSAKTKYNNFSLFSVKPKHKNQKGVYHKTYIYYLDDDIVTARPEIKRAIPYDYNVPALPDFKKDFILMTSDIDDKGMYKKIKNENKNSVKFPSQKRRKFNIRKEIPCGKIKFN